MRWRADRLVPLQVRDAWLEFTSIERAQMNAVFNPSTMEFWGIGFVGPGQTYTKFADYRRVSALMVLERQVRQELAGIANTEALLLAADTRKGEGCGKWGSRYTD